MSRLWPARNVGTDRADAHERLRETIEQITHSSGAARFCAVALERRVIRFYYGEKHGI
jgi:hypothetical protein